MLPASDGPRRWLAAGLGGCTRAPGVREPVTVRDDQGRTWTRGEDGRFHDDATGRHHLTWRQLHTRTDLVEVTPEGAAS